MNVLPAIDIREGQAVRLFQGDFSQEMIVNQEPVQQAKEFEQAGIDMIHIVDLDGAITGQAENVPLIRQIKEATTLKLEVGGGIRTIEQIDTYIAMGVDRVIIGSAAVTAPTLVQQAVKKYHEKIAVGIDAKAGNVAISGWLDVSEINFLTLAEKMAELGVQTIIYTDISKDGTMNGPSFKHYQQLIQAVPQVAIIASGGVSSVADLKKLATLGIAGTIVGKAFYNGSISLAQMLEVEKTC